LILPRILRASRFSVSAEPDRVTAIPLPELSPRRNIVVIADEAHRSQYGFGGRVNEKTGEMSYGFASNLRDALPNASFIGFTGTPIEKADANTRAVFGDYISIYDIQRAVADKATVPIYYESRIAKLGLNAAALPKIDAEFEAITEGEEQTRKEKLKTKWAALEALVGELIQLAKDMDAATRRGEDLGLTDDEVAFYEALAVNESAVQAMGDDKLKVIATELITQVRKSVTIDWNLRETARARIRVLVKRILNKYGYPPDLQEEAVRTVLLQAELLCAEWTETSA
jgi:type I site-specific restriction-modification system R (restriction) subunit